MSTSLRRMPPPPATVTDPLLNRWLLDLSSFISSAGGIDATTIPGFTALQSQVSSNSASILTLQGTTGSLSSTVSTHTSQISTLNSQMATANSNISTLQAATANVVRTGSGAPSAGLGNDGDVYTNQTGGTGTRLYGKYGGAWVALA